MKSAGTMFLVFCILGLASPNCATEKSADSNAAGDVAQAASQETSKTRVASAREPKPPPGPCRKTVEDADGKPTAVHRLSYDDRGRLVEERVVQPSDGTVDKVERKIYEGGKLVREIIEDPQSGRERPRTLVHVYDDRGQRVRAEEDFRGDPEPDTISRYKYDEKGRLVREAEDFDLDGTPDAVFVQKYDERGHLERRTKYQGTADAKENIEWSQTFEYDDKGRRIARLEDSDTDGEIDVRVEFSHEQHGNVVERATDYTAQPGVDERIVFERSYDDSGRQVRAEKFFAASEDSRRLMKATEFAYQCE